MTVRVYVNHETAQRLTHGPSRGYYTVEREKDGSGEYAVVDADPTHPASSLGGKFAPEDVISVTWKEIVFAGLRPDGYYEFTNSHLQVKTNPDCKSQTYMAWGRTYQDLKNIVLRVRTGELQPSYNFTAEAKPEMEPMVIETDTSLLPNPERIEHVGIKLRELLESARRCQMQGINHSVTWATNRWHIIVSGFVTKLTGPNFD